MTHAQAILLITPISLAMVAWALLKAMELALPKRPVPVYFSNGTVDRLAQAIHAAEQEEQIGTTDADGYIVIRGIRYMARIEGLEESPIYIRRRKGSR